MLFYMHLCKYQKNAMHIDCRFITLDINRCTKCAFESNHNATFDDENTQYASYSWFRISEFFIPDVDVIIYDSPINETCYYILLNVDNSIYFNTLTQWHQP